MGQKVNPHGLRVGVIKNWDSRWYAKDEVFGDTLVNDHKIRTYLKNRLMSAGIPKIEIERDNTGKMRVYIHCAKPGMIIGRDGTEIEKLRADIEKMAGVPVSLNVIAVKPVEMSAQLVAENIASQLERRIGFRRAMKQAIGNVDIPALKAEIKKDPENFNIRDLSALDRTPRLSVAGFYREFKAAKEAGMLTTEREDVLLLCFPG